MSRTSRGFIGRVFILFLVIAFSAKVAPCTQIAAIPEFSLHAGTFAVPQSTAIFTTAGSVICYNTTGSPATDGATACQAGSTLYTG